MDPRTFNVNTKLLNITSIRCLELIPNLAVHVGHVGPDPAGELGDHVGHHGPLLPLPDHHHPHQLLVVRGQPERARQDGRVQARQDAGGPGARQGDHLPLDGPVQESRCQSFSLQRSSSTIHHSGGKYRFSFITFLLSSNIFSILSWSKMFWYRHIRDNLSSSSRLNALKRWSDNSEEHFWCRTRFTFCFYQDGGIMEMGAEVQFEITDVETMVREVVDHQDILRSLGRTLITKTLTKKTVQTLNRDKVGGFFTN